MNKQSLINEIKLYRDILSVRANRPRTVFNYGDLHKKSTKELYALARFLKNKINKSR